MPDTFGDTKVKSSYPQDPWTEGTYAVYKCLDEDKMLMGMYARQCKEDYWGDLGWEYIPPNCAGRLLFLSLLYQVQGRIFEMGGNLGLHAKGLDPFDPHLMFK